MNACCWQGQYDKKYRYPLTEIIQYIFLNPECVNPTNIPKLNQHTPDQKNKQNAHDKTNMNGVCKKNTIHRISKKYIFFSKFDTTGLCIL